MKSTSLLLILFYSASIFGQHDIDSLKFSAIYNNTSSTISSVDLTFLVENIDSIQSIFTYISGVNLKESTTFTIFDSDYNCGSIFATRNSCSAKQKVKLIVPINKKKPIETIFYVRVYVSFKDRIYSNELLYER